MDIQQAKIELSKLKNSTKYDAMIKTAAIITLLLEKHRITPIIVGGLSVEIYTQSEYSTRDIDFVSDGYHIIEETLLSLGFDKKGRIYYHSGIEVAVEVPDNTLAGSYDKVAKLKLDEDYYVYLISAEDIILDRLRAGVHWASEEDQLWAFKLLSLNYDTVDVEYLKRQTENLEELTLLNSWLDELDKEKHD